MTTILQILLTSVQNSLFLVHLYTVPLQNSSKSKILNAKIPNVAKYPKPTYPIFKQPYQLNDCVLTFNVPKKLEVAYLHNWYRIYDVKYYCFSQRNSIRHYFKYTAQNIATSSSYVAETHYFGV